MDLDAETCEPGLTKEWDDLAQDYKELEVRELSRVLGRRGGYVASRTDVWPVEDPEISAISRDTRFDKST